MPSEDYSYIKPEEISPLATDLEKTKILELPPIETPVVGALELSPHTPLPYDHFPKAPSPPTVKDIEYVE
ncbi:hypothetical protein COV58_00980 [Candidatus Roizmanbacteria bacterium CG11_big_fil_rev_8_21_14_0_20_36_8]|uniref:Uncharacterized protein n=2 Tax=Candidatus Roizmaniibacteriota TaxID=1752723 RepID=A0A2M6IV44_9BACT|nr:MAG: hypothetical protein COV58_00980 [Candidatus Roizmanbacteria bacterium CG11_big_fil_rev_8_21_14_0_20_36_8]PIZ63405.1 MAG: hypothetical protein COY16_02140 [Candidatus Roizmanbacteria bacterium CG_4_10_14_0_2_um_filter_39_13]